MLGVGDGVSEGVGVGVPEQVGVGEGVGVHGPHDDCTTAGHIGSICEFALTLFMPCKMVPTLLFVGLP